MIVLKFGGSSVASATAMSRVLDIVEQAAAKDRVLLVSSAISGCTDALIEIGKAEDPENMINALRDRHLAIIARLFTGNERAEAVGECRELFSEIRCIPPVIESFGELLSTRILARKLSCEGYKTLWMDSRDLVVTAPGSGSVGGPVDLDATGEAVRTLIAAHPEVRVFVAPGFIARDTNGKVVTLGRGGSDYSASLFAAAVETMDLQIWTDVPGIMTANPKVVPAARTIPEISYKAAFDMATYGAKVLYAPAVEPARRASPSTYATPSIRRIPAPSSAPAAPPFASGRAFLPSTTLPPERPSSASRARAIPATRQRRTASAPPCATPESSRWAT